jgi:hypothetical protein
MNFDQASTGRASEPARVTITTMDINPAIVGPVLNAHYPHMSADGNGWHFASLQGDIIITWIGKLPAAYGLRFDLIASIRARLEEAGYRCYDLEYYGKLCVAIRREQITYTV